MPCSRRTAGPSGRTTRRDLGEDGHVASHAPLIPSGRRPAAGARAPDTGGAGLQVVFVYGDQRRGLHAHELLAEAQYLGEAETLAGFALYTEGAPSMVATGARGRVRGELYAVDPQLLQRLDWLEGHPMCHRRATITVQPTTGPTGRRRRFEAPRDVWTYLAPEPVGRRVPGGDYAPRAPGRGASATRRRKTARPVGRGA